MLSIPQLVSCIDQSWSPEIGDPTFMGWTTVVFYFAASFGCFMAGGLRVRDKRVWIFLSVFLLLLGVNKQLDLQSALTATGRCLARMQGWYGERRTVQLAFIIMLVGLGTLVLAIAFFQLRKRLHRVGLALLGFGFLVMFVAVRAIGFHHFDQFISERSFGVRMNWLMELTGIGLILINALAAIKGRRRAHHDPGTASTPYSRYPARKSRRYEDE